MYVIDEKTKEIHLTRGNKATLGVKAKVTYVSGNKGQYIFQIGDVVSFAVYEKKGLTNPPLVVKTATVTEETEIVDICLGCDDTSFGEKLNKEKEFWFEVKLNDEQTLVGYDDDGPKLLILYPEGADK